MADKLTEDILRKTINRTLDDTANAEIKAGTIEAGGLSDWNGIMNSLKKWQTQGYLLILKNPITSSSDEVCVVMKKFIERKSSIPGFLDQE